VRYLQENIDFLKNAIKYIQKHNKKKQTKMKTITRTTAIQKIKDSKGKFFTATFTMKSGDDRTMNCRTGVKKNLKGTGAKYDAGALGMTTVWDTQKKDYRTINNQTIKALKIGGEQFKVK